MPYRPKDIYRGRRKYRVPLMIGLFLLALLVVGTIVMFYVLQQFLVYDQTGVSLQLPFMETEDTAGETETEVVPTFEPVTVQVIYEEPDFSDMDLGGWQSLTATKARFIPYAEAADEMKLNTALANISAEEYTGVVLELKDSSGQLAWASTCDTAISYGTAGVMDYTETVAALHERGFTAAAQISCLTDELLATRNWLVTLQTENGAYTDSDGRCWLDPYNRTVRDYIADLMAELSAMGFDEIILADLYHPVRSGWDESADGETSADTGFTYSVTLQTEPNPVNAVCQMARRLVEGMEDTDTAVSAVIDEASLVNGESARTGQDITLFWRIFARLYCPCDTWDAATDLEYAAEVLNGGEAAVRFVPVCNAYDGPDGFDSFVLAAPSES
ncbi:MAG: putative glycoside hydrolase [Oscillospiraceae bacterium]